LKFYMMVDIDIRKLAAGLYVSLKQQILYRKKLYTIYLKLYKPQL